MDAKHACAAFAALGQASRLEIVDLLLTHDEGIPAGEIARQLDIGPSGLSAHLSILARANLVTSKRHGRSIVYHVNKIVIDELGDFVSQKVA